MANVHGGRLQNIVTGQVKRFGQALTVTRRSASGTAATTTQTIYFMPQPVNARMIQIMLQEGAYNAGEQIPMNFVCGGAESVIETEDKITYQSFYWRVVKVINENPLGGISPTLSCLAVREEVAG